MELKPGSRWKSAVCSTEVVVIKPARQAQTLECGGQPMLAPGGEPQGGALVQISSAPSLLGKRYHDEASGLELLCAKAGDGGLSLNGVPLLLREAKRLPSSD